MCGSQCDIDDSNTQFFVFYLNLCFEYILRVHAFQRESSNLISIAYQMPEATVGKVYALSR